MCGIQLSPGPELKLPSSSSTLEEALLNGDPPALICTTSLCFICRNSFGINAFAIGRNAAAALYNRMLLSANSLNVSLQ